MERDRTGRQENTVVNVPGIVKPVVSSCLKDRGMFVFFQIMQLSCEQSYLQSNLLFPLAQ